MITAHELTDRAPVWAAMSEFFLDTELELGDLERIAEVVARSKYTVEQLESILFRELVPALWTNVSTPAGEWGGFDQDWLQRRILRRSRRFLRWPCWLLPRSVVREPWQRVREIVRASRS
ncbi:MAG: hypothetical protein NXI31_22305 [bacterium]|nr:hypothetical protein [bacterium]